MFRLMQKILCCFLCLLTRVTFRSRFGCSPYLSFLVFFSFHFVCFTFLYFLFFLVSFLFLFLGVFFRSENQQKEGPSIYETERTINMW